MWNKFKKIVKKWQGIIFIVPVASGLVIAVRGLGWFQPLEWAALDAYFKLRPQEAVDNRIVIVGVSERDIENLRGWPTNDWVLAELLDKIKNHKPRAIGLDIYRNKSIEPGSEKLNKIFKNTSNLIGVQKVISDKFSPAIPPPPLLKHRDRVSANDLIVDSDGTVRRAVLFPIPGQNIQTLGLALSLIYLDNQGIKPTTADNGFMQLGSSVFVPFNANDGGYVGTDAGGYQTLLNFRGLAGSFNTVSITDVLKDRISADLMRDRVVLIGAIAPSLNDSFFTPYSRGAATTPIRTPGVEIQANIASQIISLVLDKRPLIKTWSEPVENLWIVVWSLAGVALIWGWSGSQPQSNFFTKLLLKSFTSYFLLSGSLIISSYLAFLLGWWVPVAPPLIVLVFSTLGITAYVYFFKFQEVEGKNYFLDLQVKVLKEVIEVSKQNGERRQLDSSSLKTEEKIEPEKKFDN